MITVVVLSLILCVLLCILSSVACYVSIKTVQDNFAMQDRMKEYNRFHTLLMDTLDHDTVFLKSTLAKKLSMEIPETRELSAAITKFQVNLEAIRNTLKQYRMSED